MIRVVLADDHTLVREGIRALLALVPDMSLVGEAKDGTEAVRAVVDARPDVLLLDMRMPSGDGLWVVRELRRLELLPPTLILTTFDDDAAALDVVRAGARGYLLQDVTLDRLVDAVRTLGAACGCSSQRSHQQPAASCIFSSFSTLAIPAARASGCAARPSQRPTLISSVVGFQVIVLGRVGAPTENRCGDVVFRGGVAGK